MHLCMALNKVPKIVLTENIPKEKIQPFYINTGSFYLSIYDFLWPFDVGTERLLTVR